MIPDSITSIKSGVFAYCSNLKSVTLPETLTEMDEIVFYSCNALESITLPDSLTSISENLFYRCTGLANVQFGANTKTSATPHFTAAPVYRRSSFRIP